MRSKLLGSSLKGFFSLLFFLISLGPVQTAGAADVLKNYPDKTITIYVAFPPGGIIDTQARLIGQHLSEILNSTVIVHNAAGAGGNVGTAQAYRGDSDGYTLLATTPGPMAMNQFLYQDLNYNPEEFVPVSLMTTFATALVVRSDFPADSIEEFVEYAKEHPGEVTFASQGNGATSHLAGELLAGMAGLDLVHIPYKGEGPAMLDLVGGRVDMFIGNLASVLGHVDEGQAKMLAVTSGQDRHPMAPDTPVTAETELSEFDVSSWYGIVAAPGTPKEITEKLSRIINEILAREDVGERLRGLGADVKGTTPDEFEQWIQKEREMWKEVIEKADISMG